MRSLWECSVYHGPRWHAAIVYVLGFWLLDLSNNAVQVSFIEFQPSMSSYVPSSCESWQHVYCRVQLGRSWLISRVSIFKFRASPTIRYRMLSNGTIWCLFVRQELMDATQQMLYSVHGWLSETSWDILLVLAEPGTSTSTDP